MIRFLGPAQRDFSFRGVARPAAATRVICARVCGSLKPADRRTAMAVLTGSSTAEVDAPLGQVWALVEDVERAPEWQGGLKSMRALERDDEGHAILCQAEADAKVRTIKSTVRYTYNAPTTLAWRQEK